MDGRASRPRRAGHEQRIDTGSPRGEGRPCAVERERHQSAGGELRRELCAEPGVARTREERGEILEARVVADEHRAADLGVEGAQQGHKGVGVREAELVDHVDARSLRQRGTNALEGVDGAPRRRAQHHVGPVLGSGKVLTQAPHGLLAPRREWPVVIGERRIAPRGLGVAHEQEIATDARHRRAARRRGAVSPGRKPTRAPTRDAAGVPSRAGAVPRGALIAAIMRLVHADGSQR
jgi:hypothetical protein